MSDFSHSIIFSQKKRSFYIHTPPQYSASNTYPLVVGLHGGGANAQLHIEQTKMNEDADTLGFVCAYPNGTGLQALKMHTWNAATCCGEALANNENDVSFLSAMISDIKTKYAISKVFISGFSNGAMMSYYFAGLRPSLLDGIGIVSGDMPVIPTLSKPLPLIHFHGLIDTACPFKGGPSLGIMDKDKTVHNPVMQAIEFYKAQNECSVDVVKNTVDYERHSYKTIIGEERVVLYKLHKGGHTWPGGKPMPQAPGPMVENVDASRLMLEFFKRF